MKIIKYKTKRGHDKTRRMVSVNDSNIGTEYKK